MIRSRNTFGRALRSLAGIMAALTHLLPASVAAIGTDSLEWARGAVSASGIDGGLCVILNADGEKALALAQGGKFLVHGLCTDEATLNAGRKMLTEKGLYGLATLELWPDQERLPYAENLVNLLVADREGLKARGISDTEILRALVPKGVARIADGAAWSKTVKTRPADMDDWTHFDYDASSNPVSRDRIVGPSTTLKWINWYRSRYYSATQTGALRVWDGYWVCDVRGFEGGTRLNVWDAWNGIPYWSRPMGEGGSINSYVAADGKIFSMTNPIKGRGPMVSYDIKTGALLRQFTEGGIPETYTEFGAKNHSYESGWQRWSQMRYDHGKLFQAIKDTVFSLNPETGARLWAWADPRNGRLLFPAYSADLDLIFVASTERVAKPPNDWMAFNTRWPSAKMLAVVALRGSDGTVAWTNTKVAGQGTSCLAYNDKLLAYMTTLGIGAPGREEWNFGGVLDAESGALLWSKNFGKRWLFTAAMRKNVLYHFVSGEAYEFDPRTGAQLRVTDSRQGNTRCTRVRSTVNYDIMGFGAYLRPGESAVVGQHITRSDCMTGQTPAGGMTYATPNRCGCFSQLRGFSGLGSEPLWVPIEPQKRLDANIATAPIMLREVRSLPAIADRTKAKSDSATIIQNMWTANDDIPYPETAPVIVGDLSLTAVVNEHRLEARKGTEVVWSYVAGGRIVTEPLIYNGKVYVSANDGSVACLEPASGRRLWHFLAAPNHRKMVAYGQLESSWPVMGMAVHEGLITVNAGRHPELDGGIYIYGLNPASGAVSWSGRLYKAPDLVASGRVTPNSITNPFLESSDSELHLVSRDATNLGVAQPGTIRRVTIDPKNPSTVGAKSRLAQDGNRPVEGNAAAATGRILDLRGRQLATLEGQPGATVPIPRQMMHRGQYMLHIQAGKARSATILQVR